MSKTLAAMHPYFLPHKAYFELVEKSDVFVLLDSSAISNRKWVKGNFFILESQRKWVSVPLASHSQHSSINTLKIHKSFSKDKLLDRFDRSKHNHPNWATWKPVVENYLDFQNGLLVSGLVKGFDALVRALSIKTEWYLYSELDLESFADRSARMANLCRRLGATTYLNNESGMHLYDERLFHNLGVELKSFSPQGGLTPEYPEISLSYLESFMGENTSPN